MSGQTPEIRAVGVIGLGIMGSEFARHIAAAGVRTLGYDVLAPRMEAVSGAGVIGMQSPAALATEVDIIITSLPSAKALEQVLFGSGGVASSGHRGLLVAETSTLPLDVKERARERLAAAGIRMMDTPVSGTGSQARNKDITIFTSGDEADCAAAAPIFAHFTRAVIRVGPFGAGSKLKYVANLMVTIHTLAAAEAVALAEKAGLDPVQVIEWLKGSGATSKMLEVRGAVMADGSYATPMMKVDVFQKDLEIISEFARKAGCPVPLFSASVPYFTAANSMGMGGYDVAAVVGILRQMAGLEAKRDVAVH